MRNVAIFPYFLPKNGRHFEKNQKFKKVSIQFICHPEYFILVKFQLYSTFTAKVDSKNVKCQFLLFEVENC